MAVYGREMYDTWHKALAMIEGGLDIPPVITHRFPLEEFEAAFAALRTGEASKIILDVDS